MKYIMYIAMMFPLAAFADTEDKGINEVETPAPAPTTDENVVLDEGNTDSFYGSSFLYGYYPYYSYYSYAPNCYPYGGTCIPCQGDLVYGGAARAVIPGMMHGAKPMAKMHMMKKPMMVDDKKDDAVKADDDKKDDAVKADDDKKDDGKNDDKADTDAADTADKE